jgi:hypothetical protein
MCVQCAKSSGLKIQKDKQKRKREKEKKGKYFKAQLFKADLIWLTYDLFFWKKTSWKITQNFSTLSEFYDPSLFLFILTYIWMTSLNSDVSLFLLSQWISNFFSSSDEWWTHQWELYFSSRTTFDQASAKYLTQIEKNSVYKVP